MTAAPLISEIIAQKQDHGGDKGTTPKIVSNDPSSTTLPPPPVIVN